MKWLWITALLFLVTGVKSGPTRKDGDIVDGTIIKIERTTMGDTRPSDEFQFTLSADPPEGTETLLLEVYADGMVEEPVVAQGKLPTFVADLTMHSGKEAFFLITALKNKSSEILAEAHADLKPFPNFPGVTTTQNLVDPRDPEKKKILLRVGGSLGDMRPQKGESLIIGDINYFAFPDIGSVDYVPWNKSNGVDVYDKRLNSSDPTGTVDDTIVSSAVLAYGTKPNATIKLLLPDTPVGSLEAILIPQPPEKNALCTRDQVTGTSCTIDWPAPSSAVLQLIIIRNTTGTGPDADPWATYSFDIHDRALVVTKLGTDIIEGRWNILVTDPSQGTLENPKYQIKLDPKKLNEVNSGNTTTINVDCSQLIDTKLCFGYFPGVGTGTYTLTVVPDNGTAVLDQIESIHVDMTTSCPELEILSRHTTTHRNQQKADVQICFQHLTPTEGRSFSHYEMLIINEKGQWLKHRIMQEEEEEGEASEERLCFAPFTISTKDFDLTEGTKVVVSQRAVDGVSVLASGESALF